jgi:uncharacterized membrane-anchored protein
MNNDMNLMKNNSKKERSFPDRARPLLDQHSIEIQPYGTIAKLPIALAESVCNASVENLNQFLADTTQRVDKKPRHRNTPFLADEKIL